jgi:hypothetical protein
MSGQEITTESAENTGLLPETRDYHPAEYEAEIIKLRLFASIIQSVPLERMLEQAERAEGIGPLLDPTLYREKMDGLQMDIELLRAFVKAKRDTRKAVERFIERAPKARTA